MIHDQHVIAIDECPLGLRNAHTPACPPKLHSTLAPMGDQWYLCERVGDPTSPT